MPNTGRRVRTRQFINPSECDEYLFDIHLDLRRRVLQLERRTLGVRVLRALLFIRDIIWRAACRVRCKIESN